MSKKSPRIEDSASGASPTRVTQRRALGLLRGILGTRIRSGPELRPETVLSELSLSQRDFRSLVSGLRDALGEGVDTIEPWEVTTVQELVELANEMASAEVISGSGGGGSRAAPAAAVGEPAARPTVAVRPGGGSGPRTRGARPPVRTSGHRPQPRPPSKGGAITTRPPVTVRRTGRPTPSEHVVLRHPPWEVDPSAARFRTQRRAAGSCTGRNFERARDAFFHAFELCSTARHELRWLEARRDRQAGLWNAFHGRREASLGFWFGETVPTRGNLSYTIRRISTVLAAWNRAFEVGFRGNRPVFLRCKVAEPLAGNPAARHVARNTIELMPRFFRQAIGERRSITMLHEMGHWCIGATKPRDERNSLCSGGWNRNENMCYRQGGAIDGPDDVFTGGNPRALALAYDGGNAKAKTVALNNIDNYVSYMWNRFVDRGHSVLDIMESASPPKPAKPASTTGPRSKPVPG